jgi:hypothetical protein
MFCPRCRSEYAEGIKKCKECEIRLVDELPPDSGTEMPEVVTVFSSYSPAILAMAESFLESAGILYFVKDDLTLKMFEVDVPAEVQVAVDDAEDARKLLEDLKEKESEEEVFNDESDDYHEEEEIEEEQDAELEYDDDYDLDDDDYSGRRDPRRRR